MDIVGIVAFWGSLAASAVILLMGPLLLSLFGKQFVGGYHLMFLDLKTPPVQGKRFKGTLVFEKAGKVNVEYVVEGMGEKDGGSHMNHMNMKH